MDQIHTKKEFQQALSRDPDKFIVFRVARKTDIAGNTKMNAAVIIRGKTGLQTGDLLLVERSKHFPSFRDMNWKSPTTVKKELKPDQIYAFIQAKHMKT